jgi:hypothetical protein
LAWSSFVRRLKIRLKGDQPRGRGLKICFLPDAAPEGGFLFEVKPSSGGKLFVVPPAQ